ncbi:hypothetical protein NEIMUCOT_04728 [Neisseria mucosa ATCC 25996]|uniref:Uncharacterized protein n=1 Tax=Neisseria mucosa (strain ATCC 25996 / DSM 4631 / NCTC 10774 / M26) TaxID=546266 RepID=D2ZVT5_NEIM2|nr:hypothetical protein NEIMUCOT_04728 [Neisseria mucosa ATCC 25996]
MDPRSSEKCYRPALGRVKTICFIIAIDIDYLIHTKSLWYSQRSSETALLRFRRPQP